jgi:phage/plasmid-like protein (TIGR03299 family)
MSAAIETSGRLATFASRAVPAWHNLGTVFAATDEVTTADMLRLSHLADWKIRLQPLANEVIGYNDVAAAQLVVRDNPFGHGTDILAVVGDRYTVLNNEEVMAFGHTVSEISGTRWETMGSIREGRQVFGALAFDDSITLDPNGRADKIDKYLTIASSHDGSMPVTAFVTNVRVVCQNTLNVALAGAKQSFKVRHTTTVEGRVHDAREALAISVKYDEAFEAAAQSMIQTEITKSQFETLVESIYPRPEEDVKGAVKRWETKRDLVESIYLGSADGPNTTANVTGTVWGAMNALTERIDYYRNARADSPETVALGASGLDANATTQKQMIFNRALAMV